MSATPSGSQRAAAARPGQKRAGPDRAMAALCGGIVIFLLIRDTMLAEVGRVEVWFGLEVYGIWAALSAPLHYAIYGGAAWAFWRGSKRVWPLAIAYAGYIAISHLIWNLTSPNGGGIWSGAWQLVLFSIPAFVLAFLAPPRSADA